MSYLFSDGGVSGLGQIEESWGSIFGGVGKILEPLAVGGALAYGDYQKSRVQEKDIKARKAELTAVLAQREKEAQLQAAVARQKSVTAQARSAIRSQGVQIAVAGLVTVGVLGTVGYFLFKGGK